MKHLIVIISLFVFVKSFSQNTPPVATTSSGKAFSDVTTNITLKAVDQDGDNLTYTLITSPSNGTASITDGVLIYTSNSGFTGSDTITYKVNDGLSDSNEAQLQINVIEKEPNLNWATYYSTSQLTGSVQDDSGNTFAIGRFWDFSNFRDNTSLGAIYPEGEKDGYVAKYNNLGDLQWVSTFGGEFNDLATDIAIGNDGNLVVVGTIRGVATFSDGSTINAVGEGENTIVLKINPTDGSYIWKKQITTEYLNSGNLVLDSNNNIYISSTISDSYEFPIGSGNYRSLGDGWFFKLNYSTGDILISDKILKAPNSAFSSSGSVHSVRDIVLDSNNNIIITGAFYGEIYVDLSSSSSLIMQGDGNKTNLFMLKYDSDFNLLWNFQTGNDTPHEGYNLAYDSLNDLIYLSGFIGGTVNVNPLGEEYNLTSEGGTRSFIAAYDTNGQIEFGHVFSHIPGQNTGSAADVFLNILDNKLLVYGKYRGSPDLDITDDIMVPTISTTSWKSFASVYDLVEGPALIGQYFFGEINSSSSGNPSEIILNGNDLIIATDKDRTMELYDYNQNPLVTLTNIAYENDNTYQSYSALVNYNITFTDFSQNIPPVATTSSGKAFSDVTTNITLKAVDQDGDNLTYTLITSPSNGTASITDGVLIYTSNSGFTGSDTITYKVNDGLSDSNEAQLQINVIEKEPNLNWATYYSTSQLTGSVQDDSGNTFAIGRFWDFSNFRDNTSLGAIYPEGEKDGYVAKYNNLGDLQWVSTFGGEFNDLATDIAIGNDGNVVVVGTIRGVATFSDGEQIDSGSNNTDVTVVIKLNHISGDIIWKTTTGVFGVPTVNFRSDNSMIITSYRSGTLRFNNLNYVDGSFISLINTVSGLSSFRDIVFDNNNNVFITGRDGGALFFNKYDSSFNLLFNMVIDGTSSDEGYNLAYDSLNDLIYLSGFIGGTVNVNPLGEEYNLTSEGGTRSFIAAYDTNGQIEFGHVFSQIPGQNTGSAADVFLNILDNKLLVYGKYRGSPDLDITDDIMVPTISTTSWKSFASVYDLVEGPALIGQYFFGEINSSSSGNPSEIILNGNDLIIATDKDRTMELYDYNQSPLVSLTNIAYENDNNYQYYSALVNFNIGDTTVPVITLTGDATVTIEVGTTYTDAGATAIDNYDGDITSSIVTVNPVDTAVVGVYTVTYNVTDANGNAAAEVTRTVTVVDTTVPVITLLGENPVTIEVGDTYTDLGATASDTYDGDITSSIVTVNPVDTDVVGQYTVTYNVSDANSNAAVEVNRTVNVVDTTIPIITLTGDATVTIEVGTTYTDLGATAIDTYDGDITSSIVTVNPVDTDVVGQYTVTYNVSDANSNAAVEVNRTVNVVDTTIPIITLSGDATVDIEVGSTYTDEGATASDTYDGDITSSIVTVSTVNTAIVGVYSVSYNVTDANGNEAAEVIRTINVLDTTVPVITLTGDATVTIEVGTTYTDAGATAIDNYDGDITSSIVTVNPVDTAVVGVYTVTYNVTDANGNSAATVTRIVTVEDALSVVEIEKIELDIFPNPTSNIWQIKSSKMIESLDLFDLTGKRLIYKKTLSNDIQIDATSLPDGVYLILINKNKLLRLIKH